MRQYLDNIEPSKVEKVYGKGQYTAWHGDGKSQSDTKITFQTKSLETSGKPTEYVTIVAKKKQSEAYVTYTSGVWTTDTAAAIIAAMITVLPA